MEYDASRLEREATTSLVLGILSIVCGISGMMLIGTILGIIGIVQGSKSKDFNGTGRSGFVCSIIGTVISSFFMIVLVAMVGFMVLPMFCMPLFFWI